MWKVLTAQIREKIYSSLIKRDWSLWSRKDADRARGKGELFSVDPHILKERKQDEKI